MDNKNTQDNKHSDEATLNKTFQEIIKVDLLGDSENTFEGEEKKRKEPSSNAEKLERAPMKSISDFEKWERVEKKSIDKSNETLSSSKELTANASDGNNVHTNNAAAPTQQPQVNFDLALAAQEKLIKKNHSNATASSQQLMPSLSIAVAEQFCHGALMQRGPEEHNKAPIASTQRSQVNSNLIREVQENLIIKHARSQDSSSLSSPRKKQRH